MKAIYNVTAISRLTNEREPITGYISKKEVAEKLCASLKRVKPKHRVFLRPRVEIASPPVF